MSKKGTRGEEGGKGDSAHSRAFFLRLRADCKEERSHKEAEDWLVEEQGEPDRAAGGQLSQTAVMQPERQGRGDAGKTHVGHGQWDLQRSLFVAVHNLARLPSPQNELVAFV